MSDAYMFYCFLRTECDRTCKSCNGPRSDQCVSCTNSAQVVLHGKCLDYCPDNFYIRSGKCIGECGVFYRHMYNIAYCISIM